MNVHEAPKDHSEIEEKRELLRSQLVELGQSVYAQVTCAACSRRPHIHQACRCLECGLFFCPACAKVHFWVSRPQESGPIEFVDLTRDGGKRRRGTEMHADKHGNKLNVEDEVTVRFKVDRLYAGWDFCNATLRSVEEIPRSKAPAMLLINTKMTEKVKGANEPELRHKLFADPSDGWHQDPAVGYRWIPREDVLCEVTADDAWSIDLQDLPLTAGTAGDIDEAMDACEIAYLRMEIARYKDALYEIVGADPCEASECGGCVSTDDPLCGGKRIKVRYKGEIRTYRLEETEDVKDVKDLKDGDEVVLFDQPFRLEEQVGLIIGEKLVRIRVGRDIGRGIMGYDMHGQPVFRLRVSARDMEILHRPDAAPESDEHGRARTGTDGAEVNP
jgi:hypothetical protein